MNAKNLVLPLQNKLLGALPRAVFDALSPHLTTETFVQGRVLTEPGDEFDQVYFPLSGMISILAVLQDGKAIETATVGLEGAVGAMAGLGLHTSLVRCVVQLPMAAIINANSRQTETFVDVETLKVVAIFCGAGLAVSLIVAT
jgi:CRP-like cAMP-binding protein